MLDFIIVNVVIFIIVGNLGLLFSQGMWVIIFFGVVNVILILFIGWLVKCVGEVKLFFWFIIVFVIVLWVCGVFSSLNMLIFFCVI